MFFERKKSVKLRHVIHIFRARIPVHPFLVLVDYTPFNACNTPLPLWLVVTPSSPHNNIKLWFFSKAVQQTLKEASIRLSLILGYLRIGDTVDKNLPGNIFAVRPERSTCHDTKISEWLLCKQIPQSKSSFYFLSDRLSGQASQGPLVHLVLGLRPFLRYVVPLYSAPPRPSEPIVSHAITQSHPLPGQKVVSQSLNLSYDDARILRKRSHDVAKFSFGEDDDAIHDGE